MKNGYTSDLNEIKFYSSKSLPIYDIYYRETKFLYSLYQTLSNYSKREDLNNSSIYYSLKNYIKQINKNENILSRQICIIREYKSKKEAKRVIELIDYIDFD